MLEKENNNLVNLSIDIGLDVTKGQFLSSRSWSLGGMNEESDYFEDSDIPVFIFDDFDTLLRNIDFDFSILDYNYLKTKSVISDTVRKGYSSIYTATFICDLNLLKMALKDLLKEKKQKPKMKIEDI